MPEVEEREFTPVSNPSKSFFKTSKALFIPRSTPGGVGTGMSVVDASISGIAVLTTCIGVSILVVIPLIVPDNLSILETIPLKVFNLGNIFSISGIIIGQTIVGPFSVIWFMPSSCNLTKYSSFIFNNID